jgi:hypothetical protein
MDKTVCTARDSSDTPAAIYRADCRTQSVLISFKPVLQLLQGQGPGIKDEIFASLIAHSLGDLRMDCTFSISAPLSSEIAPITFVQILCIVRSITNRCY